MYFRSRDGIRLKLEWSFDRWSEKGIENSLKGERKNRNPLEMQSTLFYVYLSCILDQLIHSLDTLLEITTKSLIYAD